MEFSRFRTATSALEATVCTLVMLAAAPSVLHAEMAAGDRAWSSRAAKVEGDRADPKNIEIAIDEYRSTLSESPESLEARWKLLRALQYAVDFTSVSEKKQTSYVDEAVSVAQTQDEVSQNATGTQADQARVLFWSSIAWGMRAQRVGLLTIVRQGVAKRMQQDAEQSLKLDPAVDQGGALRLLSRLNATLPKVPFVSGWVDRKKVLPLAERAYQLDPAHPGNQLILALALIDRAPDRQQEAETLLEKVADLTPRTEFYVEDLQIRQQARDSLADLKKKNR
ncbi:MAG: hypothetical protein CBC48_02025 [bacterium TMED88]|nr:hypothetical protein [Deltaproteobacteria bacterium]OUV36620.1 MAG: hypothetical protein CBC48_02025 [bacterium TMED88]